MWAERAKYNNNFLQKQLKYIKPQEIGEMVNKEVKKYQKGNIHCDAAHNSKAPCKSANYFENRAELAYGFYALPKLMNEMACDDYSTHFKAVTSLAEYIKNPLHAQSAILKFNIVRRCQNMFLRIRNNYIKVDKREIDYLMDIILCVSMHSNGANKLINKFRQLTQLYIIIRDREDQMEKVARILPFLSQDSKRAIFLIDKFQVFDKLDEILKRDICVPYYPEDFWLHLTHILEADPFKAINRGYFEILHTRIKRRFFRWYHWEMKCFALLLDCPEGQKRFEDIDGVKEIYTILTDDDNKLDSYENVILVLANGLMAKTILWRCREFTDLPLIIMKLCKEPGNRNQQLLCLQTLREMGEMPCIKRFIKENCLEDLKNIDCDTLDNAEDRNKLVYWLEKEIYHTTDL